MSDEENKSLFAGGMDGPELLKVFKRGVQFTEELMKENERLRFRLVQLEEENRVLARQSMAVDSYGELLWKMKIIEDEKTRLLERFKSVEEENQDFKTRYSEIEDENHRLANLYIVSYALHSTLDLDQVVRHCFEILVNLVGTRDFALFFAEGSKLLPVRTEGRSLETLSEIKIGRGTAGRAAEERSLYLSAENMVESSLDNPKACVPLVVGDQLLGMFVIYSFLAQKSCITDLDRELFKLLGGHAATALYSARLHSEAANVLPRSKSYIELLKS